MAYLTPVPTSLNKRRVGGSDTPVLLEGQASAQLPAPWIKRVTANAKVGGTCHRVDVEISLVVEYVEYVQIQGQGGS